jgi:YHS domain-containing protein
MSEMGGFSAMQKVLGPMVLALALTLGAGVAISADAPAPAPGKPVNSKCPMSGKPVDAEKVVVYKGETIGFCCGNCLKKFEAEPQKHVKKVQRDAAK